MKTTLQSGSAIALLLLGMPAMCQQPAPDKPVAPNPAAAATPGPGPNPHAVEGQSPEIKPVSTRDKRSAARLYLDGSKLFKQEKYEPAMRAYEQAAALDPSNSNYSRAVQIARGHAVTALIQTAAKAQTAGNGSAALDALRHARELDPDNPEVAAHFGALADASLLDQTKPLYEESAANTSSSPVLVPSTSTHSFHLRTDKRQLIQQVYKAYGIEATIDQSVSAGSARFDLDDATFNQAVSTLDMVTNTFEVPLDAHRVVAAANTGQNRQQFLRQEMETLYLPGVNAAQMTELTNVARNVFSVPQVAVEQTAGTMTLRAPPKTLNALNATMQDLMNGDGQVMDV